MYKIALVEDEELLSKTLEITLKKSGYKVDCFGDAESMLTKLITESYDLIILDIMLPGINGDEALGELRSDGIRTPVLMLTAVRDVSSKVSSFGLGADDYLTKPFDVSELKARIEALIRRSTSKRHIPSDSKIKIGKFEVNLKSRTAESNKGEVSLSEKEANLLKFFYQNPGENLSRSDILEEVWGMDVFPTPRTIDNFVLKFRKLFEKDPDNPDHFISIHRVGYRFDK